MRRMKTISIVSILLLAVACGSVLPAPPAREDTATPAANPFDRFMHSDFPAADGFDYPFGNADGKGPYTDLATGKVHHGWYIATRFNERYSLGIHPGEDWNGAGGGNTDYGQDVYAVAHGRVVFASHCGRLWGNVVILEHLFYENHEVRRIRSLYAHLAEIRVNVGEIVKRRQLIATIGRDPDKLFQAHLHLELRWDDTLAPTFWPTSNGKDEAWVREHYAQPSSFIDSHRRLPVPAQEPTLLLIDQASYKMRFYKLGRLVGEYEVGFGQGRGQKRIQGDRRTPKGCYFVVQKHRGQFSGPYAEYYGGHWIRINYPNRYDAAWGRAQGMISAQQETAISAAWQQRKPTLQGTKLGDGIGLHGWINEWRNEGPRHLSFGCIVLHNYDMKKLYDEIADGTMVVIF